MRTNVVRNGKKAGVEGGKAAQKLTVNPFCNLILQLSLQL
jgi:hypothetical protein